MLLGRDSVKHSLPLDKRSLLNLSKSGFVLLQKQRRCLSLLNSLSGRKLVKNVSS